MAENKTKPTSADVRIFIDQIENDRRREDSRILLDLMKQLTGYVPQMWGDSIVGFGRYRYKYDSGRSGEYFLTGFSPRKTSMTIYIMPGFKNYARQLAKLGKHKHSVSCLYVNRIEAIDIDALAEMISDSVERMKSIYPDWSPK